MTQSLYWRPLSKHKLADQLKAILLRKSWLYSGDSGKLKVTTQEVDYLNGLKDAEVDGAGELLEAIDNHGTVEIWLE